MFTYLFQLGRDPLLSISEILSVCRSSHIEIQEMNRINQYLILSTASPVDIQAFMKRLGGTVKIGSAIAHSSQKNTNAEDVAAEWLEKNQSGKKIEFSMPDRKRAQAIKNILRSDGHSARYIEPKNTATILHNHLIEKRGDLTIIGDNIFATDAIQPISAFGEREFGRPGSDAISGMLPLKLAKIMINLAEISPNQTLLDPFCGSGTIITEAMDMGYAHIIGSDISQKAIDDTMKNIQWMLHKGNDGPAILLSDIKNLPNKIPKASIDAIVTEPYLGKPLNGRETLSFIEKQAEELSAFYADAFHAFHLLLKKGGTVVIVLPAFRHKERWTTPFFEIKKIGFSPVPFDEHHSYIRHTRDGQHVARDVWRFKKN